MESTEFEVDIKALDGVESLGCLCVDFAMAPRESGEDIEGIVEEGRNDEVERTLSYVSRPIMTLLVEEYPASELASTVIVDLSIDSELVAEL